MDLYIYMLFYILYVQYFTYIYYHVSYFCRGESYNYYKYIFFLRCCFCQFWFDSKRKKNTVFYRIFQTENLATSISKLQEYFFHLRNILMQKSKMQISIIEPSTLINSKMLKFQPNLKVLKSVQRCILKFRIYEQRSKLTRTYSNP